MTQTHQTSGRLRFIRFLQRFTGPWNGRNALTWVVLIVGLVLFKWVVVDVYTIPSPSMEPTLRGDSRPMRGDYVAVNKLAFGLRIPFTTAYLFRWQPPRRWDVVVFRPPERAHDGRIMIKRVVGLPGERVQIYRKRIIINGELTSPPEQIAGALAYSRQIVPTQEQIANTLLSWAANKEIPEILLDKNEPGLDGLVNEVGILHNKIKGLDIASLSPAERQDLVSVVDLRSRLFVHRWLQRYDPDHLYRYGVSKLDRYALVPEGHYYLLGDNGEMSVDSRVFGWVPQEHVYGRAFAVVLPPGHMRDLTGFSQTWGGRLMLFVVPAAFILLELSRAVLYTSWKIPSSVPELNLMKSEHIAINRLCYGFRVPFTKTYLGRQRPPRTGEIVAFVDPCRPIHSHGWALGRIAGPADDGSAALQVESLIPTREHRTIDGRDILGRIDGVWWPLARRRPLDQPVYQSDAP